MREGEQRFAESCDRDDRVELACNDHVLVETAGSIERFGA
jgi:hypothetical protein